MGLVGIVVEPIISMGDGGTKHIGTMRCRAQVVEIG